MEKMMKKIMILTGVLILILIGFLTIISSNPNNYINIPEYTHSYTKAVCTEQNLCQDYEIFCKNQDVISMSPITGAVIQFPTDWEDPRDEKIRDKFC